MQDVKFTAFLGKLKRLERTSWLPKHASAYMRKWQGMEGQLNIAWILSHKTEINQDWFNNNQQIWLTAYKVCNHKLPNGKVGELATLLSEKEFARLVTKNPDFFVRFAPIPQWELGFKAYYVNRSDRENR